MPPPPAFLPLLRKCVLVRARGRSSSSSAWNTLSGWIALLLSLLVPPLLVASPALLRRFVPTFPHPPFLPPPAADLDSPWWSGVSPYEGPAYTVGNGTARVLLAPDTPAVRAAAERMAKALSCPPPPGARAKKVRCRDQSAGIANFYCLFGAGQQLPEEGCDDGDEIACMSKPQCYRRALERHVLVERDEASALERARRADAASAAATGKGTTGGGEPLDFVDAVVVFDDEVVGQEEEEEEAGDLGAEEARRTLKERARGGGGAGAATAADAPSPPPRPRLMKYRLRLHASDAPPLSLRYDLFDVHPGPVPTPGNLLWLYRRHWFLLNLQHAVDRAVVGGAVEAARAGAGAAAAAPASFLGGGGGGGGHGNPTAPPNSSSISSTPTDTTNTTTTTTTTNTPYPLRAAVEPFPWPAKEEDVASAAAAALLTLVLALAFLSPARGCAAELARERELGLREALRVAGLGPLDYWLPWLAAHGLELGFCGALCAAAARLPFPRSSFALLLLFFLLLAAALVAFAHFCAALAPSARASGTLLQVLYVATLLPALAAPAALADASAGAWLAVAAASPAASASLFATALLRWERVSAGLTLETWSLPLNQEGGFSARSVYLALLIDLAAFLAGAWLLEEQEGGGGGGDDGGGGGNGGSLFSAATWKRRRVCAWVIRRIRQGGDGTASSSSADNRRRRDEEEAPLLAASLGNGDEEAGAPTVASASAVAVRMVDLRKEYPAANGRLRHRRHGRRRGGRGEEEREEGEEEEEQRRSSRHGQPTTAAPAVVAALDGLTLDVPYGRVTALLGRNGAGKTTAVSVLTGATEPTSGTAEIGGLDVRAQMPLIRAVVGLGVCPQRDRLWPQLTVREHLLLLLAVKRGVAPGVAPRATGPPVSAAVEAAARALGLGGPLLDARAGALSGGQRRRLSLAIALVGDPRVVFLDEPTSGMDPASRRATWEAVRACVRGGGGGESEAAPLSRQQQPHRAVVLTTHNMEEADALASRVAVLREGRLAAVGSPLELRRRYGAGYTLTVVVVASGGGGSAGEAAASGAATAATPTTTAASSAADALLAAARRWVPGATLMGAAGSEVVLRLPAPGDGGGGGGKTDGSLPPLLRALDAAAAATRAGEKPPDALPLPVLTYGISVTTLEDVFLRVSAETERVTTTTTSGANEAASASSSPPPSAARPMPPPPPLPRAALFWRQLRALFIKRLLAARRDPLALVGQVLAPALLVLLAVVWARGASGASGRGGAATPPSLPLTRGACLRGAPALLAASPGVRNDSMRWQSFVDAFPADQAVDTGADALFGGGGGGEGGGGAEAPSAPPPPPPPAPPFPRTLEGLLLRRWYAGRPSYDALFVQSLPSDVGDGEFSFALLANQSAVHALPAALSQAHSALLRALLLPRPPPPPSPSPSPPPSPPSPSPVPWSIQAAVQPLPSWRAPSPAAAAAAGQEGEASGGGAGGGGGARLVLLLCLTLAAASSSAAAAISPVRERRTGAKHVQLVSGAFPLAYWLANYAADGLVFLLGPAAAAIALVALARPSPLAPAPAWAALLLLLLALTPASLSVTYLLTFFSATGGGREGDEVRAVQALASLYASLGFFGFCVAWLLELAAAAARAAAAAAGVPGTAGVAGALGKASRAWDVGLSVVSPHYNFAQGLYDVMARVEGGAGGGGGVFPPTLTPTPTPTPPTPFAPPPSPPASSPLDWALLGPPLRNMAAQALVAGALVLLADGGVIRACLARLLVRAPRLRGGAGEDDDDGGAASPPADVRAERAYVEAWYRRYLNKRGERNDHDDNEAQQQQPPALLLCGLRKAFSRGPGRPPAVAVRALWLSARRGECLGLLGANGAGKTTALRCATGDALPDRGEVLVAAAAAAAAAASGRSSSLASALRSFSGGGGGGSSPPLQGIGYCPQFDGLPPGLTGREALELFARLRGRDDPSAAREAQALGERMGLAEPQRRRLAARAEERRGAADVSSSPSPPLPPLLDCPWAAYSGGNRRRLAAACALAGCPPLLLLDEPSTGLDPAARRGLWRCVREELSLTARAGGAGEAGVGGRRFPQRAAVLTTHSMEEAEALCDRVAVMGSGDLLAVGGVQQLKAAHGGGRYTLEARAAMGKGQEARAALGAALAAGAAESGGGGGGTANADDVFTLVLPAGSDLAAAFEAAEDARHAGLVEAYALLQPSLEKAVLALARCGGGGGRGVGGVGGGAFG